MADADTTSKAPESTDKGLAELQGKVESELSSIKEQLQSMNQQYSQGLQEIKSAVAPKAPTMTVEDDDIFDPKTLRKKIINEATGIADSMIRANREKDIMIYNLAQDYPELQSDRELQNEMLAAQKALPKDLQDTAIGYKMAALEAVTKKGLIAKSKRQVVDQDIASGGARSAAKPDKSQAKVSDKTIAIAELLRGRTLTEDEKKSLAATVKRDTYSRYR